MKQLLSMCALFTAALVFGGIGACASDEPSGPCVGPFSDVLADAGATTDAEHSDAAAPCVTCPGATMPPLAAMRDFQPNSCRYGDSYSPTAFKGRTTVVALLAAW